MSCSARVRCCAPVARHCVLATAIETVVVRENPDHFEDPTDLPFAPSLPDEGEPDDEELDDDLEFDPGPLEREILDDFVWELDPAPPPDRRDYWDDSLDREWDAAELSFQVPRSRFKVDVPHVPT